MQISEIRESGCNNTLTWAIANGADIKIDRPLQSIINNELFYIVTMKEVNFFEVFRLAQMYRHKLRIMNESRAEVPLKKLLDVVFPGETLSNKEDPESKVNLADSAELAITNFINLVRQMEGDSDIIQPNMLRLYLPMISRKFDVQIPVSFIDIIDSMSADDAKTIFTTNYPDTLVDVANNPSHNICHMLQLGFLRGTSIIKYDKRYDQYVDYIKYAPLKGYNNNTLYKFSLLGFHKYDPVARGEVRCHLFNVTKTGIETGLHRMNRLSTPLEFDFAIQLPIQYMMILVNSFGPDELTLSYESSMTSILDGGLLFNDFVAPGYPDDGKELTPEEAQKAEALMNSIEAYRVRLTEANQLTMNVIQLMLESENDIDVTATFSMLPSMYMAKAVITFKESNLKKFIGINDEVLSSMFTEIEEVTKKIIADVNSAS